MGTWYVEQSVTEHRRGVSLEPYCDILCVIIACQIYVDSIFRINF